MTHLDGHIIEVIGQQPVVILDAGRAVDYAVRVRGTVSGLKRVDDELFDRVAAALRDDLLADFEAWRIGCPLPSRLAAARTDDLFPGSGR